MGVNWLKNIFKNYPRLANSAVYGSLYVGAEFSQQLMTKKLMVDGGKEEDMDYKALGRYLVVGSVINSNYLFSCVVVLIIDISARKQICCPADSVRLCFSAGRGAIFWGYFLVNALAISSVQSFLMKYKWLDRKYVGTHRTIIVKKVLLDQFIMTPPLYLIFYVSMSLLEGKKDILEECRTKFVKTFSVSCLFWLPAQTINFLYLPNAARIPYMGICSFVWMNILCWIKANNTKTNH